MQTATIQQIAKQVGVSTDTVRYYRELGLVSPIQRKNGYFEYTPKDAFSILYIKELRGQNLSIKAIKSSLPYTTITEYQKVLSNKEQELRHNIAMEEMALERIVETKKYFDKGIQLFQDKRIEIYQGSTTLTLCPFECMNFLDGTLEEWTKYFPFSYVTLTISPEQLISRRENQPYKIRFGCGILEKYFNRFNLPSSRYVTTHPAAKYARICVAVKDPFHILPADIAPLLDYAQRNDIDLKGGIGARLIFVENQFTSPIYYFMFWANVEKAADFT